MQAHDDAPGEQAGGPGWLPWVLAAATLGAVLGLDQLTKQLVQDSIARGDERSFLPGVELVNTRNRGVAFGFLPGSQTLVTILIGVALLVLLVYFARHSRRALMWLPTGMLIGGALGNILDRVRHGSVTDFVKLPLGWPPFNLADAAITLGILALLAIAEGSSSRHRRDGHARR
ncbi:MAG TPA: signal peptidase II [Solirubrobacteraceae bacterium]|nr:signal peptidase II [Solirubrobacteraceae bacterium]